MELDPITLWAIGIIATLLAAGIKFYEARTGKVVQTVVKQWIVFGLSLAIALIASVPVLPPLHLGGDPTQIVGGLITWVSQLIAAVGPYFTVATLVYTTLLKQLVDKQARRFAKPAG